MYFGGGGGFGDPLERDPDQLVQDVLNEYVSVDEARKLYGVIINGETLQVDQAGTEEERQTIRKKRLGLAQAPKLANGNTVGSGIELMNWAGVISLNADAAGDRYWQCKKCDHVLGDAGADWKNYAAIFHAPMEHGQPEAFATTTEEYHLRECYCPNCGGLFEVLNLGVTDEDVVTFKHLN
ncbi:MAG: hypothetical protein F4147_05110 [Gammaproteobacteria bacterium]|nr:hypothetical protein [Gammaproteobacteria bacterium]